MNYLELIGFAVDLVGVFSDLNEFLSSDSNANVGVVLVGFLGNKKNHQNLGD